MPKMVVLRAKSRPQVSEKMSTIVGMCSGFVTGIQLRIGIIQGYRSCDQNWVVSDERDPTQVDKLKTWRCLE